MRRKLVFVLVAALGLAGPAGKSDAADLTLGFYSDVGVLVAQGRLDEAEAILEDAFLTSPDASPEDRVALLDALADVQIENGKPADAGDTLWNKAALLARRLGPDSPDLTPVYLASGAAYLRAGSGGRAVAAFEAALRIDRRYLACDGPALADLYRQLAEALDAADQNARANDARRLAGDPGARCAAFDPGRGIASAAPDGEGAFARVEVLFATDRKMTASDRPDSVYLWERGELSFGRAVVTIPRDHKPGQIEAPSLLSFTWQENPALHVVLASVEALDAGHFFEAIGTTMAAHDSDEVFVFIHGFNVTFAAAAKRTAQMVYDLNFEGAPVFYSWPSRGRAGAYMSDAATVQVSARHLLTFLEDLVTRSGAARIHIVAHSMGNRALTEALEFYALRHPDARGVFDQIIFAAPDVDAELFALQTATFARLARRLTLYTSNADLALTASQQLHGNAPRAGLAVEAPLVTEDIDTIDMSVVGEGLLNHSYFASDASALADILWLFWRNPPPPSRCGMSEEIDGGVHWIYVAEACESNVLLSAIALARRAGAGALAELDARIAELQAALGDAPKSQLLDELQQVRAALVDLQTQ